MATELKRFETRGAVLLENGEVYFVSVRKDREKNYCRKYQGWGISADIIEELKKLKCDVISIAVGVGDDAELLIIDFDKFLEKSIRDTLGVSDPQYFVADEHFTHERIR